MVDRTSFKKDFLAGLVVFLIALPLCLGIALASNAPMFSGLVTGVIGGIVVGYLSGSHTSVSGPAAGLTAVVATQIFNLGSFEAFLVAVFFAGVIQLLLGLARAGLIAIFFPTSVIKGLLTAIGVILVLKQIPHLFGHDHDPTGEMQFLQPDQQNTFSEILLTFGDLHIGASIIGLLSLILVLRFEKNKFFKLVPLPLAVVVLAILMNQFFSFLIPSIWIGPKHLVNVPIAKGFSEFMSLFYKPDFSVLFLRPDAVILSAITIAAVASVETLLNIEAVDKIDPKQRWTPPNRELLAQGVGNICAGLLGGLPMTSVVVRSSVNINANNATKNSSIFHGVFLLAFVVLLPSVLNLIPLSTLAAILIATGLKLAHPSIIKQMIRGGYYQWIPYLVTVLAIVFTDLLIGVGIGFATALCFIIFNHFKRPIKKALEQHLDAEVLRLELASNVSFLGRATLLRVLNKIPTNAHVLMDARKTDFMDSDVIDLIHDFKTKTAPARGIHLSLTGFEKFSYLDDEIRFSEYSSQDVQQKLRPQEVLELLQQGNQRFVDGKSIMRDYNRQIAHTAAGQHPLAVVLSCIDSRTPAEIVFDTGLGEIFSARVAGNITSPKVIGSIEYACLVARAKLIIVLGHTQCGAVTTAVEAKAKPIDLASFSPNIQSIVTDISHSIVDEDVADYTQLDQESKCSRVNLVAKNNVRRSIEKILESSPNLKEKIEQGEILIRGAMYDVATGEISFFS